MKKVGIAVYEYDELSEEARNRALNDEITFILEMENFEDKEGPFYEDFLEAERLKTPWFLGQIIFDNNKEEILERLRLGLYHENGSFFSWKEEDEEDKS